MEKVEVEKVKEIVEESTIDEVESFSALGRKFKFVKMYSPTIMMVWEVLAKEYGWNRENLVGIDVHKVDISILKHLGVWEGLSDEVKKEIENPVSVSSVSSVSSASSVSNSVSSVNVNNKKKEEDKMGRKSKHIGIPNELTCGKCGNKTAIAPSILVVRIEKSGKSVEDFISGWACSKCVPAARGRKPNLEFANYPKELTCACGYKINSNISYLKAKAEKTGTTIQALIDGFKCQKCVPTKGRHKSVKVTESIDSAPSVPVIPSIPAVPTEA
jgi:hypothetical protein